MLRQEAQENPREESSRMSIIFVEAFFVVVFLSPSLMKWEENDMAFRKELSEIAANYLFSSIRTKHSVAESVKLLQNHV